MPRGLRPTLIPICTLTFANGFSVLKGIIQESNGIEKGGCPSQWDDSTKEVSDERRQDQGIVRCLLSIVAIAEEYLLRRGQWIITAVQCTASSSIVHNDGRSLDRPYSPSTFNSLSDK